MKFKKIKIVDERCERKRNKGREKKIGIGEKEKVKDWRMDMIGIKKEGRRKKKDIKKRGNIRIRKN